jgi:SAM-dependent methyltransferase
MPSAPAKKKGRPSGKKKSKKSAPLTAGSADRHQLYERSVQSPEAEVSFLERVFKKRRNRVPSALREDFCGTSFLSCTWVRNRKTNTAVGVDLDEPTLNWARKHNLSWLTEEERSRVTLLKGDVLSTRSEQVDILAALNFSYFTFKTRQKLRDYFRAARRSLKDDGLLVLDCYGGYDAYNVLEEDRDIGEFTYVWDQASYNPLTNEVMCHIHFRFKKGPDMKKAFTYDWRLWSLAEIQELLSEAGYRSIEVYWEGSDKKGEGNGVFRPTTKGEVCAGWIAYVVAEPG